MSEDLLQTLRILSEMYAVSVNNSKDDEGTFDVRRTYTDECKFWDALWEQSQNNDPVCDVTLKLDDETEIRAHWCILLLCPYFNALHSSGLYDKQSGAKLDMTIASADVVRLVIEFLYRGRATVPKKSIKDVIHCADYLQIDNLKSRCADYIRDHSLNITNCVSMCSLANTYNLEGLYEESTNLLRRRFKDVMRKEDILNLWTESLKQLLSDKNLRYVGQIEMFKLLVRWTAFDSSRKDSFFELFDLLDLKDIPVDILETELNMTELVISDDRCSKKVQDCIKEQKSNLGVEGTKDVLVLVSGQKWESPPQNNPVRSPACYGFVVQDNRWVRLSNVPRRMNGKLAVKNGTEMYVLGREDVTSFTRLYKLLDKEVKEYWVMCSLEQPRTNTDEVYAAVFCKDKLVSVRREGTRLIVCAHNPNMPNQTTVKNITQIPSTNTHVNVRMACYKDRYAFILVKTSRTATGPMQSKTAIFDTETNLLDIPSQRSTCQGEIFYMEDNKIHVATLGKRNRYTFCLEKRKWSSIRYGLPDLPDKLQLRDPQTMKVNDYLYVVGGFNPVTSVPSRDIYRLREKGKEWEKMAEAPADVQFWNASCCHFAVPRELLRCPHDCTHCTPKLSTGNENRYDFAVDDEDDDDDIVDDDSFYGLESDSDDFDYFDDGPGFFFW